MTNDLTKGSPLKQILFFSIPFLIGNLFQQVYNIADMVIVGRTLGSLAYTAVGSTGSIVWFASGAVQSLTVGFSVIIAQAFGANDAEKIKKSFGAESFRSERKRRQNGIKIGKCNQIYVFSPINSR